MIYKEETKKDVLETLSIGELKKLMKELIELRRLWRASEIRDEINRKKISNEKN